MSWNHRVVAVRENDEDFLQIHEVHYDGDGNIEGWTERGVAPGGTTTEELRADLQHMLDCLSKTVLVEKDGKLVPYGPRESN